MSGIIEQTVLYHTQLQYARMVSLAQQLERALMARRHPLAEAVLAAQLDMNEDVGRPPSHTPSKPGTQSGSMVIEGHADTPGLVGDINGDGPGKKAQGPTAQTPSNNPSRMRLGVD